MGTVVVAAASEKHIIFIITTDKTVC